jgi:hypothetical protein
MFYQCARYFMELPGSIDPGIGGGIIAALARPRMGVVRKQRKLTRDYPWLHHRLFDPQLYLADLPSTAKHVPNLATYPWFGVRNPVFKESEHIPKWMQRYDGELREEWKTKKIDAPNAVSEALELQMRFGAEKLIIPGPLTTIVSNDFQHELVFIDEAIRYAKRSLFQQPLLYATVAITDTVLRGVAADKNPLLRTISDQIAARDELAGAYIVIEQSTDSGHCYNCEEGCLALLMLTDELTRGAKKDVIINYAGMFGAACMAAGASIWSSGHYRSQRRLRLADEEDSRGTTLPRFYSLRLAGDIGLEDNLELVYRSSLKSWIFAPDTRASKPLLEALRQGKSVGELAEWSYTTGNKPEPQKHYYELCVFVDRFLEQMSQSKRLRAVQHWLEQSVKLATKLKQLDGFEKGSHTDVSHQEIWLNAFSKWREIAQL